MRAIVHKSEPKPGRIEKVIVTNYGGDPGYIGKGVEQVLRGQSPRTPSGLEVGGIEVIREPAEPPKPETVDLVGIPYEDARVLRTICGREYTMSRALANHLGHDEAWADEIEEALRRVWRPFNDAGIEARA